MTKKTTKSDKILDDFELFYEELPNDNKQNSRKYLTKAKQFAKIKPVKLKRKDDKTMTTQKTKTNKSSRGNFYAIAWLLFIAQQTYIGITAVQAEDFIAVLAGVVSLAIVAVIIVATFIKAYK